MKKKIKTLIAACTLFAMMAGMSLPVVAMPTQAADGTYYEKFTFSNTTTNWSTSHRMYMKKVKDWNGVINFSDSWANVSPLTRPNGSPNTVNVVMNGDKSNVNNNRYSEKWGCLPTARTELPWNKGISGTSLIKHTISGWVSMQHDDSGTTYVRGTWSPK